MRSAIGIATAILVLSVGVAEGQPRGAEGRSPAAYLAGARECQKWGAIAQSEQKEWLRLLERIGENRKVETNRLKLVAAWGRYREANDRIDECMKKYFDELPRL